MGFEKGLQCTPLLMALGWRTSAPGTCALGSQPPPGVRHRRIEPAQSLPSHLFGFAVLCAIARGKESYDADALRDTTRAAEMRRAWSPNTRAGLFVFNRSARSAHDRVPSHAHLTFLLRCKKWILQNSSNKGTRGHANSGKVGKGDIHEQCVPMARSMDLS